MKEGNKGVSVWQPRGRQVYTGRGEESSCYRISLGTSFIYSTALLLTSCPHTSRHYQTYMFPCLHCWNVFFFNLVFPWVPQKSTENTAALSPVCLPPFLYHFTSSFFHQTHHCSQNSELCLHPACPSTLPPPILMFSRSWTHTFIFVLPHSIQTNPCYHNPLFLFNSPPELTVLNTST